MGGLLAAHRRGGEGPDAALGELCVSAAMGRERRQPRAQRHGARCPGRPRYRHLRDVQGRRLRGAPGVRRDDGGHPARARRAAGLDADRRASCVGAARGKPVAEHVFRAVAKGRRHLVLRVRARWRAPASHRFRRHGAERDAATDAALRRFPARARTRLPAGGGVLFAAGGSSLAAQADDGVALVRGHLGGLHPRGFPGGFSLRPPVARGERDGISGHLRAGFHHRAGDRAGRAGGAATADLGGQNHRRGALQQARSRGRGAAGFRAGRVQ